MLGLLGTLAKVFAPILKPIIQVLQPVIKAVQTAVQQVTQQPAAQPTKKQTTQAAPTLTPEQQKEQARLAAEKKQQQLVKEKELGRDLSQVSLRDIREEVENPIYRSIKNKMKYQPEVVGAVLSTSKSSEAAFAKLTAKWGRDEELDQKVLRALQLTQITPVSPSAWFDYTEIQRILPSLNEIAARWNPNNSGISDQAFIALMIANLHQEGRLQRRNPAMISEDPMRAARGLIDSFGDFTASFLGNNASVGIANIRPGVANEIFSGIIPISAQLQAATGISVTDFSEIGTQGVIDEYMLALFHSTPNIKAGWDQVRQRDFPLPPWATDWTGYETDLIITPQLVNFVGTDEVSLELLAANIYRGIERAELAGIEPSIFNISTFLQGGVTIESEYSNNDGVTAPAAIGHANYIIEFMNAISDNPSTFGLRLVPGQDFQYYLNTEQRYITSENFTRLSTE